MFDGGDYVTIGAALLAAILSASTLVVTRRWQTRDSERSRLQHEQDRAADERWQRSQTELAHGAEMKRWMLDNLRDALVEHINLSFRIGRVCRKAGVARLAGDVAGVNELYAKASTMHSEYMDLMVYLRLYGTPSLVSTAENLHLGLDHLLDLTFADEVQRSGNRAFTKSGSLPSDLDDRTARDRCMHHREVMVNEARELFGLGRDAAIDRTI